MNILWVQDVQSDRINEFGLKSLFPRISQINFIEIKPATAVA